MPNIDASKVAWDSPSNGKSIDTSKVQWDSSKPDFSLGEGDTPSGEKDTSGQLSGIPATAVEVGRGLEKGTGQLVSDVGFLANAGGLAKNPIGSNIQKFGQELVEKSKLIPDTNLPGLVKGLANFGGEAAPMLATFAGGEALGFAKLGEGGVKLLSAASRSEKVAGYLSHLVRPMGQATLFSLTNAINTASTLPEAMDFNSKVDEIYKSGKAGFIAGATLTPIMDSFVSIVGKYGEKAGKAFMVGMTGSPKAAEEALDLTRKQGSYDQVFVDPSKSIDQRISIKSTMAGELSPSQREAIHKGIIDQQEAEIASIRDTHVQAQRDLQDKQIEAQHQYSQAEKQITSQINEGFKIKQQAGESAIEGKIAQIGQQNGVKLDGLETLNAQKLNQTANAFDQYIEVSASLLNHNKEMLYRSVAKTDPAGGFSVDGIIGKIKEFLRTNHNVSLTKEVPTFDTGVPGLAPVESNRPGIWTAKARNTANIIPPDLAKTIKFLTGEEGYLARLEELNGTNGGKISLEMLRNDSQLIKKMAYDQETGISNSGLAQLDATIRPNRLVGDITKDGDAGHWIGSKTSLASLKEAALHDAGMAQLLDGAKSVRDEFIGNKEFTANMTPKVKALLQNKEGYEALRKFEDSIQLPSDSPVRLTNAFNDYSKTAENITRGRQQLKATLSSAIENQKASLARQLGELQRGEITDVMNKRFANKEAMLGLKRQVVDAKAADLAQAEGFKKQLQEKLSLEEKGRQQAANEIATLGSYNTALGKLQRGAMYGTFFGVLSGSPHAIPALAVTAALTPRSSIAGARAIKAFVRSNAGQAIIGGLKITSRSSNVQRLLIGGLLRSKR